jgi:hypothetical protein
VKWNVSRTRTSTTGEEIQTYILLAGSRALVRVSHVSIAMDKNDEQKVGIVEESRKGR